MCSACGSCGPGYGVRRSVSRSRANVNFWNDPGNKRFKLAVGALYSWSRPRGIGVCRFPFTMTPSGKSRLHCRQEPLAPRTYRDLQRDLGKGLGATRSAPCEREGGFRWFGCALRIAFPASRRETRGYLFRDRLSHVRAVHRAYACRVVTLLMVHGCIYTGCLVQSRIAPWPTVAHAQAQQHLTTMLVVLQG